MFMDNFLEHEILNSFTGMLKSDTSIPQDLLANIMILKEQHKLTKGTHLRKLIEEYVPSNKGTDDENKQN